MKIKFNSDDGLPLNKPLKFHAMTIIIRPVFEEGGKLYPQVFQMTLCMNYKKCCNTKKLIFQKELMLIKLVDKKNVMLVIIGILKILVFKYEPYFCNGVMIECKKL